MEAYNRKFRLKEFYSFERHQFSESWVNGEGIVIELKRVKKTCKCPSCGKNTRTRVETLQRQVRDLDVCGAKCSIEFSYYKIRCRCGYKGVEVLDFVDRYARYTKRFEEKVMILCRVMTLKDVAEEVRMDWHSVKDIDKKHAKDYVTDLQQAAPRKIGVDEIAYEKHHKYLTVVRDAESDKVIWVGKERKKETLDQFFVQLGYAKCQAISVAVVDMWDPYITSIHAHTNAQIVFDKFHILKKVNETLDTIRKHEFAKADLQERKEMKHKRFLLLSRQKHLDEEKRESLYALKEMNQNLYAAYLLKEQIADIFDEENAARATQRLYRWMENVTKAGIGQFEKLLSMIKEHLTGILNYFEHKLTNAASEGLNNKINVIKRRAYGFRDLTYFIYKIYQICGIRSS